MIRSGPSFSSRKKGGLKSPPQKNKKNLKKVLTDLKTSVKIESTKKQRTQESEEHKMLATIIIVTAVIVSAIAYLFILEEIEH